LKRSPLLILCLIALVDLSSFGLIIPLLPIYAKRFDASGTLLGLLLGCYSLAQFVFAPILGRWSDRIGRRPVLLVSVAGSVGSSVLLGLGDVASWMWMLFVARALDGVTGANISTVQAYVADITVGKERARGMGMIGATIGLGFVIGPALGFALLYIGTEVVGETAATCWPAFGAAVISCISFLLVWRFLPEPPTHEHPPAAQPEPRLFFTNLRHVARNQRLGELLLLLVALTFCFVVFETTLVYTCMDRFDLSRNQVMGIFVYIGLLIVIVRGGLVGRLVRRLREPNILVFAPLVSAGGFLAIALSQHWPVFAIFMAACVPIALGVGLGDPVIRGLLSRQAPANEQGLTMGVASGMNSLTRAAGPVIAGALYDLNAALPYWIAAIIYVLAAGFALAIKPSQERALERDVAPEADLAAGS
jgi:DHA1 family tetracycline resistance protein-like MFS transporter